MPHKRKPKRPVGEEHRGRKKRSVKAKHKDPDDTKVKADVEPADEAKSKHDKDNQGKSEKSPTKEQATIATKEPTPTAKTSVDITAPPTSKEKEEQQEGTCRKCGADYTYTEAEAAIPYPNEVVGVDVCRGCVEMGKACAGRPSSCAIPAGLRLMLTSRQRINPELLASMLRA